MITLLRTETKDISPRLADAMLRANTFTGQRSLSAEHVKNLATAIKSGAMVKADIAFAVNCKADAPPVLMNGQHTLNAIVTAGHSIRATVDTYKVTNDTDLWMLFGRFDVHKARSERNIMKAASGLFKNESLRNISSSFLAPCGTALLFLGSGTRPSFSAKAATKTEKAELVEKFAKDVVNASQYIRCMTFIPVAVCTAIIATFRVNPERAQHFWDRVMIGDNLKKNSPEWQLSRVLQAGIIYSVPHITGPRRQEMQYNLCATWWNSYILNDGRRSVKLAAMKSVVELESGD